MTGQPINRSILFIDEQASYEVGFYKNELVSYADLILVSRLVTFELLMKKVLFV